MRYLLMIGFLWSLAHAQQNFQLVDFESGESIPGAQIILMNQNNTTPLRSDFQGYFTLPNSFAGQLRISSVGYKDTLIPLNTIQSATIQLKGKTLHNVVVTAQYEATTTDRAIQKITTITADQIEKSGANNLTDVLKYQPSIRIQRDNILGSGASINGISAQNIKLLIDGVPVIGRQDGQIDLSQINLANVERIEIIEGPLSIMYGSNALGGTINVITKKAKKQGLSSTAKGYYESVGNYNLSASVNLFKGKHRLGVSGTRNYFDGWHPNDPFFQFPAKRLADTNRFKNWKPREQYIGDINYTFVLKNSSFLVGYRTFYENILNRGFPIQPYYETAFDDTYRTYRNDGYINWKKRLKKARITSILAYNHYQRLKNTYYVDLTTLDQLLSASEGAQDTTVFTQANWRFNWNHSVKKWFAYDIGTDFITEAAEGRRIEGQEQFLYDLGFYASAEIKPIDNLVLRPALRYAYNSAYESPLVPSLNLKYGLKDFQFRASVARGFRAPSLKELYFEFVDINHNIVGNQDLKSESSMNYLASVKYEKNQPKKTTYSLGVSAFYNQIENLITLGSIDGTVFTYINVGLYKSTGFQFESHFQKKNLEAGLNFNYTGRYNRLSEDYQLAEFNFTPDVSINATYHFLKQRLALSVFGKYNGTLNTFAVNSDEEVTERRQDPYAILDASLSSKLWQKRLTLTVGAKNLLGVTTVASTVSSGGAHSSSNGISAGTGRSVFMSLQWNFHSKTKKK